MGNPVVIVTSEEQAASMRRLWVFCIILNSHQNGAKLDEQGPDFEGGAVSKTTSRTAIASPKIVGVAGRRFSHDG